MSRWKLFTLAVLLSVALTSCQQFGWRQELASAPRPTVENTVAPAPTTPPTVTPRPTNTPVPLPTTTPSPQPGPTQVAPKAPTPTGAQGRVLQLGPEKRTMPPVTAVEVDNGNTKRKEIALTFDAGAGATGAPKILDALARNKVTATMFLTGQWAAANPALVKQIVGQGHEVANHSYYHPDFTTLTTGEMKEELASTEAVVQKLTGVSTRPFFRPPYGARDARVRNFLAQEGYFTIYWTLDSTDWRPESTPEMVKAQVLELASPGSIIVFHLGSEATPEVIDEIIVGLRAKGYALVTLSWLMAE